MKAHIRRTDTPLKHGGTLTADCGAIIANAMPIFWTEGYVDDMGVSALLFCADCRKLLQSTAPDKKYVYGVVNAQEIRTQNEIDA